MRVEANVSLRPRGTEPFGTRVEVKNMNSFRVGRAGDRVRDRAPGGGARRRRAARPGDARLVRGARRDLPDAGQGDVRRLPLLPRAGPAAAAPRRGLARGDPGGAAGAAGGAPRALPRRARADAPTTRRCSSPTRDATALFEATLAAGPGARAEAGRELGHRRVPAPAQRGGPDRVAVVAPPSSRRSSRRSRPGRSRGRRAARSSRRTPRPGEAAAAIVAARGFRQISDSGRAGRGRRRRRSPPTRRPSPTTGPARRRRSASSSARS